MGFVDISILVVIVGFILYGFAVGLVQAAASLIGMVFSAIVAMHTYVDVANWILPEAFANRFGVQLIVFLLIFVIVTSLVNVLIQVINKVFDVISAIPFTKSLNRLLGAVLGLLMGIVAVAAVLYASTLLPSLPEGFAAAMDESWIARGVLFISGLLVFFFPDAIDKAKDMIGA